MTDFPTPGLRFPAYPAVMDKRTRHSDGPKMQCGRCKLYYPMRSDFFGRDKSRPLGFNTVCKACRRKYHNWQYKTQAGRETRQYRRLLHPPGLTPVEVRSDTPLGPRS